MLQETGCLSKEKSSGRPLTSAENVERIRRTYERSPRKSKYEVSRALQMPQTMVWCVIRIRLQMKPYVIQIVLQLKQEECGKRMNYDMFILESMENGTIADRLIFSNKSTFHKSGTPVKYRERRSLPL
ncbi:DUF4817 domain-containing protein [Nephila pilipes]|uniref:DUF4817 domain-containing protein n=1 Tax=Nephila pilipes TaxID=299642 RepID=A0A8X6TDC4_NEPPI|nr:DUF4817 domain-containing protein [Nephila pilipes]